MSDGKVKHEELQKLRGYIEENLRATEKAGFKFIDTRGLKERIKSKQNHVIFGRRGSGKSALLQELRLNGIHSSYIDLENYKDITFPNIVLFVLMDLLNQFNQNVIASIKLRFLRKFGSFHKYHRLFISLDNELRKLKDEPDLVSEKIKSKQGRIIDSSVKAGVSIQPISTSLGSNETKKEELETTKNVEKSKIEFLKTRLTDIKTLLNLGIPLLKGNNKYHYLILDDFYFIPIDDQPFLIDYIHRLSKGTDLFFKVATIRHRTKLSTTAQTYSGVEIGSDAVEIDLDYTFDDFKNLHIFMRQLLTKAIAESDAELSHDDLFSGDGFKQLCIASGGVPRDFLSIFVKSVTKSLISDGIKIGKIQVTEEAIANLSNKLDSIRRDSGSENQLLEIFAYDLRDFVFGQKRTNCFLVQKEQLEKNIQIKQAIRELFDLRLIHILDKNTSSAPSDGKMYEAYLIDIGLYENARPGHFKPIEPGQSDAKSRKDDVRSSPRIDVEEYHKKVIKEAEGMGITKELTVTVQS